MQTFLGKLNGSAGEGVTTSDLHLLERRLIRQRVLHKALNQVERGILRLCCRLGLQARSRMLSSALASIFAKASNWLSASFTSRALSVGRPLAAANVRAAMAMGNGAASAWAEDADYLILLGVNSLGTGPPLRSIRG
jgi:hypothetical protein